MGVRRRDYEIYQSTAQQVGLRGMIISSIHSHPLGIRRYAGAIMRFRVAMPSLTLESEETLIGRDYEV